MEWNARTLGIVAAVIAIVVGAGLLFITEPEGGEGSGPSGGVADVSEETRPYLWHGIGLVVVGLVVGTVLWQRDRSSNESS